MLDCTAPNLYMEVRQAVALREKHTKMSDDIHDQFVGEAYQEGRHPLIPSYENHSFEFYVNTVPFLVYTNPKWRVSSKRPVVQRQLSEALNHGMDRWTNDVNFVAKLCEVATDCLFDFGVLLTTLEPLPGFEDKEVPPLRPTCTRISPRRYFRDPQATSLYNPRFEGHEWLRDLEDLKNAEQPDPKRPGKTMKVYDQDALEAMQTDSGDDWYVNRYGPGALPLGVHKIPRHQVRGYEIYVPERRMIYTLGYYQNRAGANQSVFLREPRPYFGPPWGPYRLFGLYAVPEQVYPLAPLAVTVALINEINAHIDQITDQADKCRQFTLVSATNNKAVQAIKEGANGDVIPVPGFDAHQFAVVTIGGPSKEQMDYVDRLRQRLDRKSGLTDFQRGNITGDATATENSLAAQAGDVRRKFMQSQFRLCVKAVGETVAWYMTESKNVVFHVPVPKSYFSGQATGGMGGQAAGTPQGSSQGKGGGDQMVDGLFLGGRQKGQEDFNFFDLELDIEPMSLEFTDESLFRQQFMQMISQLLTMAPMMAQFPFLNWPDIIDDMFATANIQDARKYINIDLLQQMTKMQFQAGAVRQIPGIDGTPFTQPGQLAGGGRPQPGVGMPQGPKMRPAPQPQPPGQGRQNKFTHGASFEAIQRGALGAGQALNASAA